MFVTAADLQLAMAGLVFLLGFVAFAGGLHAMLATEYRATMRALSAQSGKLGAKSLGDPAVVPLMDATSRLIEAVSQLVRTASGVGAFLCLMGVGLCLAAFWLLTLIEAV